MTGATLLVGGRIYTGRRYAEALLVQDDRVVAVGPEEAVRRSVPSGTDRLDLVGRLVVPGLADAHLHLGMMTRARAGADVTDVRSIPELGRRLALWAETHPRVPVVGGGLTLETLAERRWPTAQELDGAVPDRPVVVFHASGHAAVANTRALDAASASGGTIRQGGGSPGVLVEQQLEALWPLVTEALPLTPVGIEEVVRELTGLGITAVGTMNSGPEELSVLRELDGAGRLPIRVRAYPPLALALERGLRGERRDRGAFAVVGVKVFLDGAFGPRTASLSEPYADDPGTRGVEREDDARLREALAIAHRQELTPALHAIGDRAVARATGLLSELSREGGPARIEHASLTPPPVLEHLRTLGARLVVQPGFVLSDVWLAARLGPARTRWAYAFRMLSDLGVLLGGSSDAPYDPPDPWRGMRAAVHRGDELGRSANPWPEQALTEPEALALYATGAHRALGDERSGSLEVGSSADLVILSVPRLGEAIRAGVDAVEATWVGGTPVYRRPPTPASAS